VLKRTILLDFSSRWSGPTGATPCRRFGSVNDDVNCALPPYPTPPDWPGSAPARKNKLQPVIFDFNAQ